MGSPANILIRLATGGVFLTEGILKFLDPAANGAGRFANIGFPYPNSLGPFVATVETVGGVFVVLGLFTRISALALFVDISVAIFSTKIPVVLGHAYWGLSLMKVKSYGLLSMVHEARTDIAMWFCLLFLLLTGPGSYSLDAARRNQGSAGTGS